MRAKRARLGAFAPHHCKHRGNARLEHESWRCRKARQQRRGRIEYGPAAHVAPYRAVNHGACGGGTADHGNQPMDEDVNGQARPRIAGIGKAEAVNRTGLERQKTGDQPNKR